MLFLIVSTLVVLSLAEGKVKAGLSKEVALAAKEGYTVEDPNDLECEAPVAPIVERIPREQPKHLSTEVLLAARALQYRLTSLSRQQLIASRELTVDQEVRVASLLNRRNDQLDKVPYFWHHVMEASYKRDLMLMPMTQQELVAAQFGMTNGLFRAIPIDDEALVQHHLSSLRCTRVRLGDTQYFNLSLSFKTSASVDGVTKRFPLRSTSWYRVIASEIPHRISTSHSDWDAPVGLEKKQEERTKAQWMAEFGEGTSLVFAEEFLVDLKTPLTGVQSDLNLGVRKATHALPVPGALISMFSGYHTLSHYSHEQQGIVKARLYTLIAEACGQLAAMPITLYEHFMMERDQAKFMHEEDLAAARAIADMSSNY